MSAVKDKDIELWKTWKRTGSKHDLELLLNQMEGVIQKEVGRWSGALAREVLELEAARLAKTAFETYDPKAGAALSTHVTNTLQKLSRLVYTHQNVFRAPEYQTLKISTFKRAEAELEGMLGRKPTTDELTEKLIWSKAAVEQMRKNLKSESIESVGSQALPAQGRSSNDMMVDLVYHDLAPLHKSIFEHTTGYGGAEILSGDELMKQLKLSQGQLSYEKKKIVNRIQKVIGK